jgi:hypothetical protein
MPGNIAQLIEIARIILKISPFSEGRFFKEPFNEKPSGDQRKGEDLALMGVAGELQIEQSPAVRRNFGSVLEEHGVERWILAGQRSVLVRGAALPGSHVKYPAKNYTQRQCALADRNNGKFQV